MSLIVWYPFTKDFKNRGLSSINETVNSDVVLGNSNKFGTCAKFNGSSNSKILLNNFPGEEAFGKNTWSVSFWINFKNDGNRAVIIGNYVSSGNDKVVAFEINSSGGITNNSLRFYWYTGIRNYNYQSNLIIDVNKWTHVCFTYDGATINFYKNGELVDTVEKELTFSGITNNTYIGGDNRTTNVLLGELHDFRIYNHCLSSKEIKELSKGLILHYDLKGYNTNPNLISSNSYYSGEGAPYYTYKNGPSVDTVVYFKSQELNLKTNTSYTFSFDARLITDDDTLIQFVDRDLLPDSLPQSNLDWTHGVTNKWQHFSWTLSSSNSDMANCYARIFSDVTHSSTGYKLLAPIEFRNIKFEESPKETPFIPHDSFSDTTEYDLSGNGYDGVKQGITYSTDTPRYCLSSEFDGSKDLVFSDSRIYHQNDEVSNLSVSIWVNFNTITNVGNIWNLGQNYFWRIRPASDTTLQTLILMGSALQSISFGLNESIVLNTWHHLVMTFDNGIIKCYWNGTLRETQDKSSIATTIKCTSNSSRWSAGDYNPNTEALVGKLSDFRIYATTLSADDVKELYQTSATVDKTGKLYCGTLIEE